MSNYFETIVHCKSEEELQKRIADNEKRGFYVVRYFEKVNESTRPYSSKYKNGLGVFTKMNVGSEYKTYGAVMRRDNNNKGVL